MIISLYLCSDKNYKLQKIEMKKMLKTMVVLFAMLMALPTMADDLANIIERDFSSRADSLNEVLVQRFMNLSKGTFWAVPKNRAECVEATKFIYWQQAHAMDVLVYAYERIKDSDPEKAAKYKNYMELWYANHANNWYVADYDPTGFFNEFTDDMCWICLTLLHIADALDDEQYALTAKTVFDDYVVPRGWTDDAGFWGLPWKLDFMDRNACTNAPACVVASKLYLRFGDETYKQTAIDIYDYMHNVMVTELNNDGRVEDPPLTYTQGTFAEACRLLYHLTGESQYLNTAVKVTFYLCSSSRCVDHGLLRHEGTTMDQSIFKAVAIPYIVNIVLEEDASEAYRKQFVRFLQKNANALWDNLLKDRYPLMYCNYYWGEPIDTNEVPSLGAMVSGASLMENMARLALALKSAEATDLRTPALSNTRTLAPIYDLQGRRLTSRQSESMRGIWIGNGKKYIAR